MVGWKAGLEAVALLLLNEINERRLWCRRNGRKSNFIGCC